MTTHPSLQPPTLRAARWTLAVLAVTLAACPLRFARDEAPAGPIPTPPPPDRVATRLGPGDVFEVRVLQEPDLSGPHRVDAEGAIDFPFCGRLTVKGSTTSEVAAKLRGCLATGYLREPQVTVVGREYNSKKIMVFGYVQKPGTFPFDDEMTVVQAITLAGGFAQFAAQNRVVVTRVQGDRTENHKVPVQDIGLGRAPTFFLQPGDTVFVPESAI